MFENDEVVAIIPVEAIICADPGKPSFVLEYAIHFIIGKPIGICQAFEIQDRALPQRRDYENDKQT